MTHERDRKDGLLPALDDAPGPMPPLSAAEADAIAWGAVSRWAAGLPGVEPADDEVGPARPLSNEQSEHLAQRVMVLRAARTRSARVPPWAARAAAALVVCAISGVSFAAYRLWQDAPPVPAATPQPTAAGKRPAPVRVPPPAIPQAPIVQMAQDRAEAKPPAEPAKPRVDNEEKLAPEELLAHANALRAQRRWSAAERLYREALGTGANAEQRYVALVASASINLQHLGRPARALAGYQGALALRPRGDLSEEALFGVAQCQRALGNRDAERRALEQLIAEHPDSSWLDAARRRRAELQ